jgi:glycosyltransferase involved in cell wall biosynthesis
MAVFISTIIPTIGRDTLSRAVESVLDQKFPKTDFEVIVVNDSGHVFSEYNWQNETNLHIIHTNRRERSVARNVGAALARGNYLHFLDDDDWILPNTFHRFWELSQQIKAGMYYGGYLFVAADGETIEECFPNERGNCFIRFMSGEWQPLQASLFDANLFHSVGGFMSLDVLRGGDEDVDLTRRISLQSDIVGMEEIVAAIRLDRKESTTNYSNLQEQSRQSREMIMGQPGVFSRLHESAEERPYGKDYWCGRLIWIFLSSMVWNFQQRKLWAAVSRFGYLCFGIFLAYKYWFSPIFWRGATRPHQANGWLVAKE